MSLAKGSMETSQHFNQVVDEIAWETTDGLDEFCALCEEMGGAGWKSYESLNAYLDMALQLGHESALLRVGRLCRQLSGYSFEPTNRYLSLVAVVVELHKDDCLPGIEQVALDYQDRYQ